MDVFVGSGLVTSLSKKGVVFVDDCKYFVSVMQLHDRVVTLGHRFFVPDEWIDVYYR